MGRQIISKVPVFNLVELHGKTLTISVARHEYPRDGVRATVVVGTDERGISYVLVDHQERLDVHSK
jgi:hypothetical protein